MKSLMDQWSMNYNGSFNCNLCVVWFLSKIYCIISEILICAFNSQLWSSANHGHKVTNNTRTIFSPLICLSIPHFLVKEGKATRANQSFIHRTTSPHHLFSLSSPEICLLPPTVKSINAGEIFKYPNSNSYLKFLLPRRHNVICFCDVLIIVGIAFRAAHFLLEHFSIFTAALFFSYSIFSVS